MTSPDTATLTAWLVDDDESIRWVLERALTGAAIAVRTFPGGAELLDAIEEDVPDVLLTDIRMPGISGLDLLDRVRAIQPDLPIIIMTAHSDLDSAVSAYRGGAFEYLPKPFDLDEAVELVNRAARLAREDEPESEAAKPQASIIIGEAPAMQEVFRAIGRLSASNITVLITGESGTGKELVAHALHEHSPRASRPFIAVNTAAIPKDLMESEFFGHEKGAFTGATNRKLGKFEQANGGTLFLDEIGEMSPSIQAKFLRVLEGHPFERVGGGTEIHVDVRVVAATNRDLEKAIEENRFRKDLFFRLFVVDISVAPLRARASDIPILANHFLTKFSARCGHRVEGFSRTALDRLCQYDWPGNVRELQNTIERAVILARGPVIEADEIQLSSLAGQASFLTTDRETAAASVEDQEPDVREISLTELEREHILAILDRTNWNKSLTSQILGIERSTLDRKLKRYKVTRPKKPS